MAAEAAPTVPRGRWITLKMTVCSSCVSQVCVCSPSKGAPRYEHPDAKEAQDPEPLELPPQDNSPQLPPMPSPVRKSPTIFSLISGRELPPEAPGAPMKVRCEREVKRGAQIARSGAFVAAALAAVPLLDLASPPLLPKNSSAFEDSCSKALVAIGATNGVPKCAVVVCENKCRSARHSYCEDHQCESCLVGLASASRDPTRLLQQCTDCLKNSGRCCYWCCFEPVFKYGVCEDHLCKFCACQIVMRSEALDCGDYCSIACRSQAEGLRIPTVEAELKKLARKRSAPTPTSSPVFGATIDAFAKRCKLLTEAKKQRPRVCDQFKHKTHDPLSLVCAGCGFLQKEHPDYKRFLVTLRAELELEPEDEEGLPSDWLRSNSI